MKISMSKMPRMIFAAAGVAGMLLSSSPTPARASPAVIGVVVTAPLNVATAGIAGAVTIIGHEAFAKKPFGPHGEIGRGFKAVVSAPRNLIKQWFPHW